MIFDDDDDNTSIFLNSIRGLLDKYMIGQNISIITYGQTSSGKTFTLHGSRNSQGIIQMAIHYIFNQIQNDQQFCIQYFEIYNEKVFDLLDHQIEQKDQYYQQLKKVAIQSLDEFIEIYQNCQQKRRFGVTNLNDQSSRSHTILKIIMEQNQQKQCLLQFLDLAGSEQMQQNIQKREPISINQSLLCFSKLINQIQGQQTSKSNKNYISFSESCLTFQLEESFTSDYIHCFIFTINQQPQFEADTLRTLQFSQNVGAVKLEQIRNNSCNRQVYSALEQKLMMELEQSKMKCRDLQQQCLDYEEKLKSQSNIKELTSQIQLEHLNNQRDEFLNIKRSKTKSDLEQEMDSQLRQEQDQQIKQEQGPERVIELNQVQVPEQAQVQQQDKDMNQIQELDKVKIQKQVTSSDNSDQIEFDFQDENHYLLLSQINLKDFGRSFVNPQTRIQRKFNVLVSNQNNHIALKDKVVQIFNFQMQSYIFLEYSENLHFIIVKFDNKPSISPSQFNNKNNDIVIINKQLKHEDIQYMTQNLKITSEVQCILNDKNDHNYKENVILTDCIEFEYVHVSQQIAKQIIESLRLIQFQESNLINIDDDSIRFIIAFKEPKPIIFIDYFSRYHKPAITLIKGKYEFEDIKQYYVRKYKGKYYYVNSNIMRNLHIERNQWQLVDVKLQSQMLELKI